MIPYRWSGRVGTATLQQRTSNRSCGSTPWGFDGTEPWKYLERYGVLRVYRIHLDVCPNIQTCTPYQCQWGYSTMFWRLIGNVHVIDDLSVCDSISSRKIRESSILYSPSQKLQLTAMNPLTSVCLDWMHTQYCFLLFYFPLMHAVWLEVNTRLEFHWLPLAVGGATWTRQKKWGEGSLSRCLAQLILHCFPPAGKLQETSHFALVTVGTGYLTSLFSVYF